MMSPQTSTQPTRAPESAASSYADAATLLATDADTIATARTAVDAPPDPEPLATAQTAVASSSASPFASPSASPFASPSSNAASGVLAAPVLTSAARGTVLPRVEGDGFSLRLVPEAKTRYEPLKLLGTGGMGEVLLVQDQDIARPVAIKRLLPEMDEPALLARFVDEIRTVGRLEHPNIVPIHDVGIDDLGRYFFVMKYVEGETLESIIAKLAAGDPDYHRRYTTEQRVEIFIGVLQALAYAHAHGVVHRDIKPANVMVGPFGEVMLMDWGIAKPIEGERDLAARTTTPEAPEATLAAEGSAARGRMYATRVGSLVGTPAYMAPEQARGANERIDARSDLYSACVLFYELLSLRHYLAGKTSVKDLLAAVMREEVTYHDLLAVESPHQPKLPRELVHFVTTGLAKDPAQRHQSATTMIETLRSILEGRVEVQCHITLTKRMLRDTAHLLDTHPRGTVTVLLGIVAAVLFTFVQLVRIAIS